MNHSRRGFVTAGCWCVDQNKTIPFWPEEDIAIIGSEIRRGGGGSACNFAIDIRKLDSDMPVATIGLVGDDENGRFLAEQADLYGIERSRLQFTGETQTAATDAFHSQASGYRTHIFFEGTAALLSPDHFDFSGTNARIMHLGLPGIHAIMDAPWEDYANGWVAVLKRAQAAGMQTNLELVTVSAERLQALTQPCLPYLDTLVVNDFEIGAIVGITTVRDGVTDTAACREAARQVLQLGSMEVVVVHHVLGAELITRDGSCLHKPSLCVPEQSIHGANGAGDAFAAGFLYARHEGWSYDDSLALAHATAAASLRSVTTIDGVASVRECLALADAWGWRDS